MKKLIKGLLVFVAVIAVLLVALVIALPLFFDPNDHKQTITETIKDSIGREVRLDGEIKWSVFPSIALTFNDVKLANESGFKGDYLAEMSQLSAQVKLFPLLKKDIQVGNVTLKEPHINLQVSESGNSNWQSMVDSINAGQSEGAGSEASSTDLAIRGISIEGGQVSYDDQQTAMTIQLSQVNFSTDELSAHKSSQIDVSAHVAMPNEGLNGVFDGQISAKNMLNDKGIELLFNKLLFEGQMSSTSKLPLKLSSERVGVLDLGNDSLNFELVSVELGELKASTSLVGKNMTGNLQMSGDLVLNQFDVDEFLAQLGTPLVNDANNEMSGKAKWQLGTNRLSISNLAVELDEYALAGDFNINNLERMQGSFNLAMDSFNADPYIPQGEAESTDSGTSSDNSVLDFGYLNGAITIGKLSFSGLKLDNITLKLTTEGSDFTVQPLQADFYKGLIKTELQLKPHNASNKLQLTHKMSDIQAGSMLTDLMGSEFMTGLGKLDADLFIDEPFSERPFKTAHGTIQYSLSDGDIVGIDIFDIIQKSLSLMGNQEAANKNSELKTAFGLMEFVATVDQGILTSNKLSLTSPYFDVKGNVVIDLDGQTIKGTIKPMLTNIPEGVLSADYKKLLNLRIPVSLSGSLLEPSIKIDIKELILESQKEKINEKKEELKQDLFDKLLGNDKDKKRKDKSGDNNQGDNKQAVNEQGNNEGQVAEPELTEKQKKRAKKDAQKKALLESLFKSKDKKKDDDSDGDTGDGN